MCLDIRYVSRDHCIVVLPEKALSANCTSRSTLNYSSSRDIKKELSKMEATHIAILRKNLVYLKEHLEAGDALDHLYQEGVFTQSEYNRCKLAGPDRCGTMLELLMKKGEEAYKSLCAFVDGSQPHVKVQLDETSVVEGAINLLFVNKPKLEREHKKAMSAKEKIISDLQDEMNQLKKNLVSKEEELLATIKTKEEEKKKHDDELEEERKKYEARINAVESENEHLEELMAERTEQFKTLKLDRDQIKSALKVEREKYQAITKMEMTEVPVDEGQEQRGDTISAERKETSKICIFGSEPTCDESQLMLLPCLHAACKPCLDHHTDQLEQERLLCPCGGEVDVKLVKLPADHVRRNEAAYNVSMGGEKKCSYMDHEAEEEASTYCQDCDEYLCESCKQAHNRVKKNKKHKIAEIQNMVAIPIQKWLGEMYCQNHPDHKLELYDNECQKPICLLCSHGIHRHPDNEDLNNVVQQSKASLENTIRNHQSLVKNIGECYQALKDHQTEQDQTVTRLESEVVSVHQNIAGKFLHRQMQLLQDIRQSLEGPQQAVQEKLKTVRAAEKSVLLTMDYIQRAMKSTRKAELVNLTGPIEKKSAEDLKIKLPSGDTRDTRVRLFFQGQKALEESIVKFGSLASCSSMEEIADCHPTFRDLKREKNAVSMKLLLSADELQKTRTKLALSTDELQKTRTELALSTDELHKTRTEKNELVKTLTLKNRDIEGKKQDLTEAIAIFTELQVFYSSRGQDIPVHIITFGQEEVITFRLVSCPAMTLNRERVSSSLSVSEEELTNRVTSGDDHSPDQFTNYWGTCCAPITISDSPSTPTITRYWETSSRIHVKERGWQYLLEMAMTEEEDLDRSWWISGYESGWSVLVFACHRHPGFCIDVWGKGRQVGDCLSTIPFSTRGTEAEIKLGTVMDVGRGRLAFIDINMEKVLHKFDITFRHPVYPVFGVTPSSHRYDISMRLDSGREISFTDCKRKLIAEALSCD